MKTTEDYYIENGKIVLTAAFHIKRGSCCGNLCKNCPYIKPHTRGNTKLESDDRSNTSGPETREQT